MTNLKYQASTMASTASTSSSKASTKQSDVVSKLIRKSAALNNYAAKIHYGSSCNSTAIGVTPLETSVTDKKKKVQTYMIYKKSLHILFKLLSKYKNGLPSFDDLDSKSQDTTVPHLQGPIGTLRKSRPIVIQLKKGDTCTGYYGKTTQEALDLIQKDGKAQIPLLLYHENKRRAMTRMAIVVLYNIGLFYDQVLMDVSKADSMYRALLRLRRHNEARELKMTQALEQTKTKADGMTPDASCPTPAVNLTSSTSSSSSLLLEPNMNVSMIICLELAIFYASRYMNFEKAVQLFDEGFVCSLLLPSPGIDHTPQFGYDANMNNFMCSSSLAPELWADAEISYATNCCASTGVGIESTADTNNEISQLFQRAAIKLGSTLDHKGKDNFQDTSLWYSFAP